MLTPSEEPGFLSLLQQRRVPIEKIEVNPKRLNSVQGKMEAFCAAEIQMKEFAQRAVTAFAKNIFLRSEKAVFDLEQYDIEAFAKSLGLAMAPRLRFHAASTEAPRRKFNAEKYEKAKEKKSERKKPAGDPKKRLALLGDAEEDDLLVVKHKNVFEEADEVDEQETEQKSKETRSKSKLAKKLLKKKIKVNTQVKFNEDGDEVVDKHKQSTFADDADGLDLHLAVERMAKEDKVDKEIDRERVRKMHKEKKRKLKEKRKQKTDVDEELEEYEEGEADAFDPDTLPDPDKIYGPERTEEDVFEDNGATDDDEVSDENDGSCEVNDEDDATDDDEPAVKRSRHEPSGVDSDDVTDDEEFLEDNEELALRLLHS